VQSLNRLARILHSLNLVRNVVINGQGTLHKGIHQFGNIRPRLETTKGGPLPYASRDQLKGTGRYFVSRRRHANDARYTPSTMGTFQRRPHDIDVTGTIERIVDTPFGHGTGNVFLNGTVNVFGINTVRGAELFGDCKLVGIHVDGNNAGRTRPDGTLNDGEALQDEWCQYFVFIPKSISYIPQPQFQRRPPYYWLRPDTYSTRRPVRY